MALPTLSLDRLFGSTMIDVYEGRDVTTCDVPGVFLHAELPVGKRLFFCFRGQMAEIMCEVSPEYEKYVRTMKGKKVLYVRVIRSICGCIDAALLWYDSFTRKLWKGRASN